MKLTQTDETDTNGIANHVITVIPTKVRDDPEASRGCPVCVRWIPFVSVAKML